MNTERQSPLTTGGDIAPYAPQQQLAPSSPGNLQLMTNPQMLDSLIRMADLMATGAVSIPDHLKGKKGDCLAVSMQAAQWGMNPFAVAQKTHVVSGRLGYEAQLVSAVVNSSTLLQRRLQLEYFGPWEKIVGKFKEIESKTKKDDHGHPKKFMVPAWKLEDEAGIGVRCKGLLRGEQEPRTLELVMMQARTRNSTLWAEDPKQQLAYLAQKRWARLYAADVLLGVYTPDELEEFEPPKDMGQAQIVEVPPELVKRGEEAAGKGVASYQTFWRNCTNLERAQLNELSQEHERLKVMADEADKKRTVDNGAKPKPTPAPTQPPAGNPANGTPPAADPPATGTGTGTGPADDTGPPTWGQLMDRINAGDEVALMIVEDWIAEWQDEVQKKELEDAVAKRRKDLGVSA